MGRDEPVLREEGIGSLSAQNAAKTFVHADCVALTRAAMRESLPSGSHSAYPCCRGRRSTQNSGHPLSKMACRFSLSSISRCPVTPNTKGMRLSGRHCRQGSGESPPPVFSKCCMIPTGLVTDRFLACPSALPCPGNISNYALRWIYSRSTASMRDCHPSPVCRK